MEKNALHVLESRSSYGPSHRIGSVILEPAEFEKCAFDLRVECEAHLRQCALRSEQAKASVPFAVPYSLNITHLASQAARPMRHETEDVDRGSTGEG
jgi:hypothetical protein